LVDAPERWLTRVRLGGGVAPTDALLTQIDKVFGAQVTRVHW